MNIQQITDLVERSRADGNDSLTTAYLIIAELQQEAAELRKIVLHADGVVAAVMADVWDLSMLCELTAAIENKGYGYKLTPSKKSRCEDCREFNICRDPGDEGQAECDYEPSRFVQSGPCERCGGSKEFVAETYDREGSVKSIPCPDCGGEAHED